MKKVTHYFAYGSNMHRLRAGLRIPGALDIGRAELPDWKVVERLYADAVPAKGKTAEGVLYRIGDEELAALDRYEGYPAVYERKVVTTVWRGRPVRAWIYVMTEVAVRNRTGLRYPEWYRILCRDGAKAHGLAHNAFLRPWPAVAGNAPRQPLLPGLEADGASYGRPWPNPRVAWPAPDSRAQVYNLFVDAEMPDNAVVGSVLATGRFAQPATLDGRPGRVMILSDWAFQALDVLLSVRANRYRAPVRVKTKTTDRLPAWRYARR